jgi:putative phosphoribosyl transferase
MSTPVTEQEVTIPAGGVTLRGVMSIPALPKGIVVFAHGNGSNYRSPRNSDTARKLHDAGFATLRTDLLTPEEAEQNKRTGQYRFDVAMLSQRVIAATTFVGALPATQLLPLAYFGASTGAAAALIAATKRRDVFAVVSRGGRPDLAHDCLRDVKAATLLIVGGADVPLIPLNEEALALLAGEKELAIVPNATHLFEEPGAMETVGQLTVEWLTHHLPHTRE